MFALLEEVLHHHHRLLLLRRRHRHHRRLRKWITSISVHVGARFTHAVTSVSVCSIVPNTWLWDLDDINNKIQSSNVHRSVQLEGSHPT